MHLKPPQSLYLSFQNLSLPIKILNLMASISSKSRVVQWEQYAPYLMLTSSWEHSKKYIYPFIENNAKLYLRYIDDIFILWTSTKQHFENLLSELNQKHNSIKFDYEISSVDIPFLDTIDNMNRFSN